MVGLQPNQIASWLSWQDPNAKGTLTAAQNKAIADKLADPNNTVQAVFGTQAKFWIPNVVVSYWGGEFSATGRYWVRWNADQIALIKKGYYVQYFGFETRHCFKS